MQDHIANVLESDLKTRKSGSRPPSFLPANYALMFPMTCSLSCAHVCASVYMHVCRSGDAGELEHKSEGGRKYDLFAACQRSDCSQAKHRPVLAHFYVFI